MRSMQLKDVDACVRIVLEDPFYKAYGMDPARLRKNLRAAIKSSTPNQILLIEEDKRTHVMLGFAWFSLVGGFERLPYLRLIVVAHSAKGRGIGKALIETFCKKHHNGRGLMLLVTSTNRPAVRFYETLGFKRAGKLKSFARPRKDEYIYWRPNRPS